MIRHTLIKVLFVLLLTIASTVGAGVVAEEMGMSVTPQVYACGSGGHNGGGC